MQAGHASYTLRDFHDKLLLDEKIWHSRWQYLSRHSNARGSSLRSISLSRSAYRRKLQEIRSFRVIKYYESLGIGILCLVPLPRNVYTPEMCRFCLALLGVMTARASKAREMLFFEKYGFAFA